MRFDRSSFSHEFKKATARPAASNMTSDRIGFLPEPFAGQSMWIFDSYYKAAWNCGAVREGSTGPALLILQISIHLKDPRVHWDMIENLENRYEFQEYIFEAIFSTFQGHRIYASRKVAEKIEVQTRYAAELYSMDVR